jgi:hypothetical protein
MKDVHIDVADCFDGFKMNYDLDKIIKALERAKKVEELLGLYKQRDYLLSNKPKTKYQIDIWKQRLKNNQYTMECLEKQLEEEMK